MIKQNNLVTKLYLRSELGKLEKRLVKRFTGTEKRIGQSEKRVVGEMISIKDAIMKELRDWRENEEMHDATHQRVNDDLIEHEERITTLEQKTA